MRSQASNVFLGARIPGELKEQLADYCQGHGIKINFLVAEAIREKLMDIAQDSHDIAMSAERLEKPKFISQKEMDKFLAKRGIKP